MANLITPTAGSSSPRDEGWHYTGLTSWIQRGASLRLFWQPGPPSADSWRHLAKRLRLWEKRRDQDTFSAMKTA